jgi:hypothetical protein
MHTPCSPLLARRRRLSSARLASADPSMNTNVFKLGQEAWILSCCSLWADPSLLTRKLEGIRLVWLDFPLVSVVLLLVCVARLCVLGLRLAWLPLRLAGPAASPCPLVAAAGLDCPLRGCKLACAIGSRYSQATQNPTAPRPPLTSGLQLRCACRCGRFRYRDEYAHRRAMRLSGPYGDGRVCSAAYRSRNAGAPLRIPLHMPYIYMHTVVPL